MTLYFQRLYQLKQKTVDDKDMYGWCISQAALSCSKLTKETLEQGVKYVQRRQWRRSGFFIVNFEHISHLAPVFLL